MNHNHHLITSGKGQNGMEVYSGASADKKEQNSVPPNHLELFVRAGKDGESYGGCPFCQRMFMVLLLKANAGELTFQVTTVNTAKPPADFRKLSNSNRLPVLVHGNEILNDVEEMIQYIDANFPVPCLNYDNVDAATVCLELFSKFSYYIKEVSPSPHNLLLELAKLNSYLKKSEHQFLCGDHLDHLDCSMLPKLQHIRVAAKAFKDFETPAELDGLWRYLNTAYKDDVFKQSCPTDQEIVYHWTSKPELPKLSKEKDILYSTEGKHRYSFDVPASVFK